MMPGVAAQPLGGRSVFSPTVLADADYIGGVYELAGSPLAASDIIDKPGRIGASGLEILDNDVDGIVSAIGDYLALLLTLNWTVVIEWEELTSSGYTELLLLEEFGNNHSMGIDRVGSAGLPMQGYESGVQGREVNNTDTYGPGVHKVAFTSTVSGISMSTDGGAVSSDSSPRDIDPLVAASFGGPADGSYNGTFIRRVTLYAPLDDIWLPSLSA
ncbi:hypothetical protein [Mesorhizobium ciceri]|uniref:hypothetical protein n=1 Tax=Mesorhizobium TaxID=68287 RepID=UPI00047B5228|nr:hypothetical protein [Mesorhizobium ciceri]